MRCRHDYEEIVNPCILYHMIRRTSYYVCRNGKERKFCEVTSKLSAVQKASRCYISIKALAI